MNTFLVLVSGLLWWVLYSSIGALFIAIVVWAVLRWMERGMVVFNRTYFACLIWLLADALVAAVVFYRSGGHLDPAAMMHSTGWRVAMLANMVLGVWLLWRLVPRIDARRIKPTSACLAVAVVMVVVFGLYTSLVG